MLRRPPTTADLAAELDDLDNGLMGYGRALETALVARAAGCTLPATHLDGRLLARRARRLADNAGLDGSEQARARALRKVADHLHALDRAVALPGGRLGERALGDVATALGIGLDVFARPDIQGLVRLQDAVDLLLDHVEHHPALRRAAIELLGIGTAAEFTWANHPHLGVPEPA
jgi:hypothetical protein